MKNLFIEFKNSIYNPSFYKEINSKSLRNIFIYIIKIDLIISIVFTILTAFFLISDLIKDTQLPVGALIISALFGLLTVFGTVFLTVFVVWVVYGWVLGVVLFVTSLLFKKRISYVISVKSSMYAMGLGMVISVIPKFSSVITLLGIAIPILIILINLIHRPKEVEVK